MPPSATPDNLPENLGLYSEKAAFEKAARALYARLPKDGVRIELEAIVLHPVSSMVVRFFLADGSRDSLEETDEIIARVQELRKVMYKEGAGSWFSMTLSVTSEGKAKATYNYDLEPEWDFSISPIVYVKDLEHFPRNPENIPEWLQEKVAQAATKKPRGKHE